MYDYLEVVRCFNRLAAEPSAYVLLVRANVTLLRQ